MTISSRFHYHIFGFLLLLSSACRGQDYNDPRNERPYTPYPRGPDYSPNSREQTDINYSRENTFYNTPDPRDPNFPRRDPNYPYSDLNTRTGDVNDLNYNRDRDPYTNPDSRYAQDSYSQGNRNEFPDGNRDVYNRDPNDPNDIEGAGRPSWQDNRLGYGSNNNNAPPPIDHNIIINEATYFIVASKMVRPGQIYKISVNILRARLKMNVRASISNNGVELSHVNQEVKQGIPETLNMKVPETSVPGEYKLRIEGLYDDPFDGKAFLNETRLTFSRRFMTIFIQMDKPVYMQGQTVRFRTIPINTELKAFNNAIDVFILDPKRNIMKRWLSRQSNLGTVSLEYKLSDQPVYGEWIVQVWALGQVEESTFLVEEYYQTRFEVNVTMPAFFFNNDPYIYGRIMANYTSGAPVKGNLTLKATVRPIPQFRPEYYQQGQFNNQGQFGMPSVFNRDPNNPYNTNIRNPYLNQPLNTNINNMNINNVNNVNNENVYYPGTNPNLYDVNRQYDERGNQILRGSSVPMTTDILNQPGYVYDYTRVVEQYFNFDEEYPFWMTKPDSPIYGNTNSYYSRDRENDNRYLPYLRFFNGTYDFRFPMREIENLVPNLDGMEVIITAIVGERFLDEIIEGYSVARIYNSSIAVNFLGGSPQVFKPSMPFDCYIAASFNDGSPLRPLQLSYSMMEIQSSVEMRGGGRRDLPVQQIRMDEERPGIWHMKIDLRTQLNLEESRNARDTLNDIGQMRLTAYFRDSTGQRAQGELLLLSHHSPMNKHIKVSTSTAEAKVGEYIIFHVQSNFYIEFFNYLLMSKGIILTTGQQNMQESIRTFAVALSAEMAPAATIVVWCAGRHGEIIADSLTFPVNGISRNNFTVSINNRKARTGGKVEIAIYGEPGSYVGLSGIDNAFYTMQAGNELTYAQVITKMATFDEQTNGTFVNSWLSHEGNPDEIVYFPSSTFGIDANRTFEFAGLVVFSDVTITRRPDYCNFTLGMAECLNGRCYRVEKKCDGMFDCEDGTDEAGCMSDRSTKLSHFRKFRFNRILRQYENVWLWKDINIGPHGRYIFNIDVPKRPALWMVSAFSMSPSLGFGMMQRAIEYDGSLPFFMNIEMPDVCRQGEQVGVRATVFNYMDTAIEVTVALAGSPDYKFVHVEEFGIVRSYNPRTSFGEHQFFVYIPAGEAAIVHLPVVPQRLGDIDVTVHAVTLIGKDSITRKLHVEADGLPQYRHESVLLDLSNRAYVFQYMHVNVTETPIIPYDVDRYYVFGSNKARISVVGDVVGPIFPTMPVNATSLLNLPMDSAEQNMFSFAANLYTTMYMRFINQRNKTIEKDSFHHLNILYQRQLSFLKPDGSFSLFRSDWNQSDSSVWLTAFCARIFQDASFYEWENYIYIDPKVISNAISYILDHQSHEGAFYEVTWSPDRKVNSSLNLLKDDQIAQRNISLTAHVIITLETVKDLKDIKGGLGSRVALAQQRAIEWLERNLKLLADHGEDHPYDVAIVAYALMLSKASIAESAFIILAKQARSEGGLTYWGKEKILGPPYKNENQKPFLLPRLPNKYDSSNVETTAYALMTYNARQELLIEPIVAWLNSQRLTEGGWASTQDTYIAMKALIDYTTRKRIRDVSSLTVSIEATSLPGHTKTLYINENNLAHLQSIDIPQAWGTVKVQVKGAGYLILQMATQYNVDIEKFQTDPPVRSFSLYTRADFHGRNQSHITYQSCQRWTYLEESIRSGMAVLDVTIPTGYIIQQQKLDAYVLSRQVRNLQRARFQDRKVLFYFDFLDHEDTCLNFTIERWYPVANMSRYLPIRVYDYYAPERFNETIFDSLPTYLLNICEVCGSSQCPYCSIYNSAINNKATVLVIFITAFAILFSAARTRSLLGLVNLSDVII